MFRLLKNIIIGFALFVCAGEKALPAQVREEGEVKSAYLYNFAHFVTWPGTAFTNKSEPFIVAVLGEDPFGPHLEKALKNEQAKGRSFEIVRLASGEPVPRCHILFIGLSEKDRLPVIFEETKGKPILTISEINPFARVGGIIRFSKEKRRVGLVINPVAARRAGLRVNAELLSIATIQTK